jgi:ATP-dependent DNA helicase RecG
VIIQNNHKSNERNQLNAVIHRNYTVYTGFSPIRTMMFRNRLDVENLCGLNASIKIDRLAKTGADTRNPLIASHLEVLIHTENRFFGIPMIRYEMDKAKLPSPLFENSRGTFKVTLFNQKTIEKRDGSLHECSSATVKIRKRERIILFKSNLMNR